MPYYPQGPQESPKKQAPKGLILFRRFLLCLSVLLIAYGIKLSIDNGFRGDVVLEAKTTELARHYEEDYGAVRLPAFSSAAPRFLIADSAAKAIFFSYLEA